MSDNNTNQEPPPSVEATSSLAIDGGPSVADPAAPGVYDSPSVVAPSPIPHPPSPIPLRIAIVGLGGVTQAFHNWPERVMGRALVARGHTVANIGYYDPKQPALSDRQDWVDGIVVRRIPPRHWPNTLLHKTLDQLGPFDVIHLMHPRNVLAYGTLTWARKHKTPTVFTWLGPFHDRYLIDDRERPYDEQPHYNRLIWSYRDVLRRTLRNGKLRDHLRNYWLHAPLRAANALVPCSEHEAEVMRLMGLEQPQTVVPLWIDTKQVVATPVEFIDLPKPAVLFIGQLTPRKGYDLLIQALPTVLKRYPTTVVQIVSGLNEADRTAMEALAEAVGVREQIVFRGRVEDAELINLFRSADIYVSPTRYEGFGLTLLEAMAGEAPIVSSAIPVVNETIQHGVNGWLVAPNDAEALAEGMLRLLGDEALRDELRQGGKQSLATEFDEATLVQKIEAVYRSVMGDGGWGIGDEGVVADTPANVATTTLSTDEPVGPNDDESVADDVDTLSDDAPTATDEATQ